MPDTGAHCPCCETAFAAGREDERQRIRQLAAEKRASYSVRCADGVDCPGHSVGPGHTHHSVLFADLLNDTRPATELSDAAKLAARPWGSQHTDLARAAQLMAEDAEQRYDGQGRPVIDDD